jgi:hypothetical protein
MAYTKSGFYLNTLLAQLLATAETGTGGLNYTLATWKLSLLTFASVTDGSAPVNFSIATAPWVNTFENTGTGWATGGVVLNVAAAGATSVVPTLAEGTTGSVRYNWTNPLAVAGTTLTGVGGMILYADPISAPVVKPMMFSVCFGSAFSTVAGTFGITPSGTGLFEIDVTP